MTTPLTELLSRRIRQDGPISLADYMAECLLHPQHGYYATRDPFGTSGDFITAPEISQMFGEMIPSRTLLLNLRKVRHSGRLSALRSHPPSHS